MSTQVIDTVLWIVLGVIILVGLIGGINAAIAMGKSPYRH